MVKSLLKAPAHPEAELLGTRDGSCSDEKKRGSGLNVCM